MSKKKKAPTHQSNEELSQQDDQELKELVNDPVVGEEVKEPIKVGEAKSSQIQGHSANLIVMDEAESLDLNDIPEPTNPQPFTTKGMNHEDLSIFVNQMIPYLQIALVTDGAHAEMGRQIEQTLKRQSIPVKQFNATTGDPAMSNLFRQCSAVICLHEEMFNHIEKRAYASGRFVIVVTTVEELRYPLIKTTLKYLGNRIVECKRKLNSHLTAINIRETFRLRGK